MHRDYHLATIGMQPFLMTALLTDYHKPIPFQCSGNIFTRSERESVRSRKRDFEEFRALGRLDIGRLKPQFQRFLGITYGFFLGVARGSTARQFGEHRRPPFALWIEFNQQSQLHGTYYNARLHTTPQVASVCWHWHDRFVGGCLLIPRFDGLQGRPHERSNCFRRLLKLKKLSCRYRL
jgi:hypothetical protein